MRAIIYRPRSRAEVVRLLAAREEVEQREAMQRAYIAWEGGGREPVTDEGEPIRLVDRLIIGLVMAMGCVTWLAVIARIARGVWWR